MRTNRRVRMGVSLCEWKETLKKNQRWFLHGLAQHLVIELGRHCALRDHWETRHIVVHGHIGAWVVNFRRPRACVIGVRVWDGFCVLRQATFFRDTCSYNSHRCCASKKHNLAKSTRKSCVAMMLSATVCHHCSSKVDVSACGV